MGSEVGRHVLRNRELADPTASFGDLGDRPALEGRGALDCFDEVGPEISAPLRRVADLSPLRFGRLVEPDQLVGSSEKEDCCDDDDRRDSGLAEGSHTSTKRQARCQYL